MFSDFVYVASRYKHPDNQTMNEVKNILKDNDIDINQLDKIKTDHCQEAESSTAIGSFT
jgi:hypothetical protein